MSATFSTGKYGTIPDSVIRQKYEVTNLTLDNPHDQLNHHFRSVLKDNRPDPNSIEGGDNRRDFQSQQQLYLRDGGNRYENTPYAPDLFLEDTSHEPRDASGQPIVRNLQTTSRIYGARQPLLPDADNSIPDTQIPAHQLVAKQRLADRMVKPRFKLFTDSYGNMVPGRSYKHQQSKVTNMAEAEMIPNEVADLKVRNIRMETAINNLSTMGQRYIVPDGVVPMADYSATNWNKPLEQRVQGSVPFYTQSTEEKMAHRDGMIIPKSLLTKINTLQASRGQEMRRLLNVDGVRPAEMKHVLPQKYKYIADARYSELIKQHVVATHDAKDSMFASDVAKRNQVPEKILYMLSVINKDVIKDYNASISKKTTDSKEVASKKFHNQIIQLKSAKDQQMDLEAKNIKHITEHAERIVLTEESGIRENKQKAIINYKRWDTPNTLINPQLTAKLDIKFKQHLNCNQKAIREQLKNHTYTDGTPTQSGPTKNLDNNTMDRQRVPYSKANHSEYSQVFKENLSERDSEFLEYKPRGKINNSSNKSSNSSYHNLK